MVCGLLFRFMWFGRFRVMLIMCSVLCVWCVISWMRLFGSCVFLLVWCWKLLLVFMIWLIW